MTLTDNQKKAMNVMIAGCLRCMGGKIVADFVDDPWTYVGVEDLTAAGWSKKEAEGTFGSLIAAGLIFENDVDEYCLTEDWDKLAKYHA